MKIAEFRTHQIHRTCMKSYKDFHSYGPHLHKDFSSRCAYCNTKESTIAPLPFQIDHFVPEKVFKGKRDELKTDYTNLMWSCPKCNRAKSDLHAGNILANPAENTLFYRPDDVSNDGKFFRNEMGLISSDDAKGQAMIALLKLHRPIYAYAWVYELLEEAITKTKKKCDASSEEDSVRYKELLLKLHTEKDKIHALLCQAYKER